MLVCCLLSFFVPCWYVVCYHFLFPWLCCLFFRYPFLTYTTIILIVFIPFLYCCNNHLLICMIESTGTRIRAVYRFVSLITFMTTWTASFPVAECYLVMCYMLFLISVFRFVYLDCVWMSSVLIWFFDLRPASSCFSPCLLSNWAKCWSICVCLILSRVVWFFVTA